MNREGMSSGEMSELRMAAIVVWYLRHLEGREAWAAAMEITAKQSLRMEQFRAELSRIVGERDDLSFRINGGCVEAEIEDLHFIALEVIASGKQEQEILVTLLGRCSSCGVETASEPIHSFADLGKMLERFEPCYQHICYA